MTAARPLGFYEDQNGSRTLRPHDGRRSNLSLVLQSLYDDPQLTRADLARLTGLTKVTISDLVAELIDEGLVAETGMTSGARPGKPAATLAVRDDTCDIMALDLSAPDVLRAGIYSMRGENRARVSLDLDGRTGPEAVDAVLELAERCASLATRPILGVGVGTPGTVDTQGTVIAAPNFDWYGVDLQDILAERLQVTTVIQNDANAAVIAETAFSEAGPTLVRVQISRGVGAGILLSGSLVLGTAAAAGEIGHVVIEHQGAMCSCGKRGCVETWISAPALQRRLSHESARREDVLAEAGRRLGMALAPIVAALDLTEVVVGGPEDLIDSVFIRACQDLIVERTRSQFRQEFTMRQSSLGGEAVLLGAVSLVMRTTLGVS
ncbi:MAG: ROK family transcriptional regulator [Propionibacteriaceae bacterium]|nr:ROK family transcriptional regulator [Propionibacteriaceae bacterium]